MDIIQIKKKIYAKSKMKNLNIVQKQMEENALNVKMIIILMKMEIVQKAIFVLKKGKIENVEIALRDIILQKKIIFVL